MKFTPNMKYVKNKTTKPFLEKYYFVTLFLSFLSNIIQTKLMNQSPDMGRGETSIYMKFTPNMKYVKNKTT